MDFYKALRLPIFRVVFLEILIKPFSVLELVLSLKRLKLYLSVNPLLNFLTTNFDEFTVRKLRPNPCPVKLNENDSTFNLIDQSKAFLCYQTNRIILFIVWQDIRAWEGDCPI